MITKLEVKYTEVTLVGKPFTKKCSVNNIVAYYSKTFEDRGEVDLKAMLTTEEAKDFMELCNKINSRITCEIRDA